MIHKLPMILLACVYVGVSFITLKTTPPMTTEDYAEQCGLSYDEFVLFSSVVEAESNRQAPEEGELTTEGRVFIALTIINRQMSERFPDTITGVLTQRGQFSTVVNGHSVTNRTTYSDEAIVEAYRRIEEGNAPAVLFFNCRYFFSGREPYPNPNGGDTIGGNYFSL